jgi:hypothetical protein
MYYNENSFKLINNAEYKPYLKNVWKGGNLLICIRSDTDHNDEQLGLAITIIVTITITSAAAGSYSLFI